MSKKHLFSIITVVYNDGLNLEKTILNVLGQDFDNFQYIIIDGGSNDNTLDIISKYKGEIDLVISERDKGIYDAMNKGINNSNGEWVNFLNAGDTYDTSKFLSNLASKILDSNVNLIYTDSIIRGKTYSPKLTKNYLVRNMLCHQSIFYKSDLLNDFKYDLRFKICADFAHLIEIYSNINSLKINGISVNYLGGGVSENSSNKSLLLGERLNIILNSKFNLFYKCIFFIVNRLQFYFRRF